jgi:hypothetical protein
MVEIGGRPILGAADRELPRGRLLNGNHDIFNYPRLDAGALSTTALDMTYAGLPVRIGR